MDEWSELQGQFHSQIGTTDFLDTGVVNYTCACGAWVSETEMMHIESPVVYSRFDVSDFMNELGGEHAIGTTMHHLYHLALFEKHSHVSLEDIGSVFEFGAGYGNMARIMHIINPDIHYEIYDLEGPKAFQKWYLGKTSPGMDVIWVDVKNYVNDPDLFISTWALSEAPVFNAETIVLREFFLAKHGLLAWQPIKEGFPQSQRFDKRIRSLDNVNVVESPHQESFYAFW